MELLKEKKRYSRTRATRGELFNALPEDIRAKIFALVVVSPVKWEAKHKRGCELGTWSIFPGSMQPAIARGLLGKVFKGILPFYSFFASRWAPNPDPRPVQDIAISAIHSLPCLCARRNNLQPLLVCHKWYAEAAFVFYSQNTFAFADPNECSRFLARLRPEWKQAISSISLFSLQEISVENNELPWHPLVTAEDELYDLPMKVRHRGGFGETWQLLRKLPNLSYLELDARYLTRLRLVRILRGGPLRNLRTLQFTMTSPLVTTNLTQVFVWPRQALRIPIIDDDHLIKDITRWIMGRQPGSNKYLHTDRILVDEEVRRYKIRLYLARLW
ncbi:hypothetical protein GGR54DRAFT_650396 [Hypoxylon sp. NC1633]|nr:hypothetical protein GGR54DRAFT_650396 [Hypoxylon sp. NC1633]